MPCTVVLETYGKAVVVKGETRSIKDFLKAQGGRWNPKATAWMYPGSKKDSLIAALKANPEVGTVADKTGGAQPSSSAQPKAPAAQAAGSSKEEAEANESPPKARTAPGDGGGADETIFDISEFIRATVSSFRGNSGVDVRKFYKDRESGEMRPTAKGVRLAAPEWESLLKQVGAIDAASGEETKINLEKELVVTVRPDTIDIRKFYTDKADGELKPTKKGCNLQRGEWAKLKMVSKQLSEALGKAPATVASPAKKKAPASAAESPAKKKQRTEAPAAAAAEEEDGGNTSSRKIRKTLEKLLEGRDFSTLTPKVVRAELEAKLKLPEGALLQRKGEIQDILTQIIQS